MTPYIDTQERGCDPGFSWADHFRRVLAWHYGPERAAAIAAGNDPTTQSDLSRWNSLGRRSAA